MPATLVSITEEQRTPSARHDRLRARIVQARKAMTDEILLYAEPDLLQRSFEAYEAVQLDMTLFWERRAAHAFRDLRTALGSDLTDEARDRVLATLYGEARRPPAQRACVVRA